ncbi:hypothetical protein IJD44_04640 [bacterium]|nr:hypothetical protein [bacterium]
MNLTISATNNINRNNHVSFGLAKFSEKGMHIAQSCSDIYECLSTPNEFQNPDFFKKKGIFSEAPFTKFLRNKLGGKCASDEARETVRNTIVNCGTTENGFTNAAFIRQLLSSQKVIGKLDKTSQGVVSSAAEEVFKQNWNNPELTKAETFELLELTKKVISEREYATLTGVIEKSDM